jgi:hypothetical protein
MSSYFDDGKSQDMSWLKFFPAVHKSKDADIRQAVKDTENRRREIAHQIKLTNSRSEDHGA